MTHCPGCHCRRPRLPDSAPASTLILLSASPGQALHGLLWLAWQCLPSDVRRRAMVRRLFHDRLGLLHRYSEYLDEGGALSWQDRKGWQEALGWEARLLERRLGA